MHIDATIDAMERPPSRRTTLTLPSECLDLAERIARERHLSLSSVVAEALQRGLWEEERKQRSEAIAEAYTTAFNGFSDHDLMLLDGIVMEPLPVKTAGAGRSRKQRNSE